MTSWRSPILIVTLVFGALFSMLYYIEFVTASNADKEFCKPMAYVENRVSFDFKFPSYLPDGYRYQCGFADGGEGHVVYWNQTLDAKEFLESQSQFVELHKGAISQRMVMHPDFTNGTALVVQDYNNILEGNPALNPKIVDVGNGRIAWVNGITEDGARQTAEFPDGKVIVVTSNLPSRLRTYYDNGYGLHLEGYVTVDELIKIARSMQ